ncbi:hypothetical protein [Microbacterium sp. SD291]|uniref:hypothetical protein n=1 Tax=Microbacterium sp. SD291 TaxID=2782007 RepID=UPI001A96744F|nr:hypothetical protein [Microbacterium sp. SD291]MBO0979512.1 hypothetical protein [Microbacterium sp. SD291]
MSRVGPFLIALIVGCCVMLVATIALGLTTVSLLRPASAIASPSPTATADPPTESASSAQTVRGIEVETHSDLEFGDYAMSGTLDGKFTVLVAPLSWADSASGIHAFFDVTAYDAEGHIVDRTPTNVYVLPEQEGFFQGIFSEDLSDVVRISVEQTSTTIEAPLMSGAITMTRSEALEEDRKIFAGGNLTSTLSVVPKHADVFIAGYSDGVLFGYCSDIPDIPAGGEFVAICELTPVTADDRLPDGGVPDDAEFRAYLALDPLSQE